MSFKILTDLTTFLPKPDQTMILSSPVKHVAPQLLNEPLSKIDLFLTQETKSGWLGSVTG